MSPKSKKKSMKENKKSKVKKSVKKVKKSYKKGKPEKLTPKPKSAKKSTFKKGKKKKTQALPSLTKRGAKGTKKVLAIRHARHEHLGTMETFLKENKIGVEYLDISEKSAKFPKNPEKYSCIIYLGGPMTAVDLPKDSFLAAEVEFIQKAYEKKVAQVGFCLGAQLMAVAFKGGVYKGSVKEIGWYSLRLTREGMRDPLLIGFESEPTLFQWHQDGITLPKDVPSLAGNLIYPNQAFRMNSWTYAFQFHFEVDEKMIAAWIKKGGKELKKVKGYINPKKIKDETKLFAASMKRMAGKFYESLFEYLGYSL